MEEPKGKSYDGPSGVGRDSIWLTAEDLVEGRDLEVKIEDVKLYPSVKFMGGRERVNLIGLKFAGKSRVLGLNATNRKALNKMFGNIVKGWKGQVVSLYVAETQMAGETVKCVRIRNKGSRTATAAEQFLAEDAQEDGALFGNDVETAAEPGTIPASPGEAEHGTSPEPTPAPAAPVSSADKRHKFTMGVQA